MRRAGASAGSPGDVPYRRQAEQPAGSGRSLMTGRVVADLTAADGGSGAGRRTAVAIDAQSACGRCSRRGPGGHEGAGCGIRLVAARPLQLDCDNPLNARTGDTVSVDVGAAPGGFVGCVAVAYGLPAVLLLAGAMAGDALGSAGLAAGLWGGQDAAAALGALAGLIGGLVTGRYASRVLISKAPEPESARIVAVLNGTSPSG